MKIRALHLRGCTRLASASPTTARRAALLRLVEGDADALEGEKVAWARALAMLLRAGISRLNDDSTKAADDLERAIAALDAADMSLYSAAARRQLGVVRGGTIGTALVAEADAFMRDRHIRMPDRMSSILVPGFPSG